MLVFVSVSLNNMPMLLLLYFSVLVIFYGTWDFAFFCKFYPSTHTHRYMLTHHANLFPILPPSKELYCTFAEIIIHKGMEANACVQLTISKGYLSEIFTLKEKKSECEFRDITAKWVTRVNSLWVGGINKIESHVLYHPLHFSLSLTQLFILLRKTQGWNFLSRF